MHSYLNGGVRKKYTVLRADGTPTDHEAAYFVLRLDADPHARKAALAYAESVEEDNPEFAEDIRRWVGTPIPVDEFVGHGA